MKKILISCLLIMIIFSFNIDAKAEQIATCYYNYTHKDSDFKYKKKQATLIALIYYDKSKHTAPQFYHRIIKEEDANFTDGYKNEFSSDIDYQSLIALNTVDIPFYVDSSINLEQILDNNGELMCPNLHLLKVKGGKTYNLTLIPDTSGNTFLEYEEVAKIESDKSNSYIKNDGKESPQSDKVALSCNYSYSQKHNPLEWFTSDGQVGFSVMTDGSVSNIIGSGGLNNSTFKYEGENLGTDKCPDYIKLKQKMTLTNSYIAITLGTSSDYDAAYVGKISSGEDNQTIADTVISYKEYPNGSKKINLKKSGSNYIATYVDGTSEKAITISNIESYKNNLDNKKYPTYIIKEKNKNNYILNDQIKDTNNNVIETDEVFINRTSLLEVGLNEDTSPLICEDILGSLNDKNSLISILDSYVIKTIQIGVPILLIILTSFDFVKALATDDDDGFKNAIKNVKIRIVAAIGIFITPMIIITLANLLGASHNVTDCIKALHQMSESEVPNN